MISSKWERWSHRLEQLHVLPWLFFLTGLLGVVAPCVWPGYLPGDLGDARFNLYVLEHYFQAVRGVEKSFTDAPFYYPWPATIGFSDTHWGTAPIYALFRFSGMSTTGAFAAWFVVGNALNFLSAYVVLRRFGLAQLGAGIGAFLFAFSLPASAQFGHAQLTYRYGVPVSIYFFHGYLTTRKPLAASLSLLFLSLQILATLYIGFFLGYFLAAWFCGWCYLKKIKEGQSFALILKNLAPTFGGTASSVFSGGIAALAIVLLMIAFLPYVEVHSLYGFKRDWSEIQKMLPRLQSYFLMDSSLVWSSAAPEFSTLPYRWEHQMFLGSIALLAIFCTTFYEKYFHPGPVLFLMRTSFFILAGITLSVFDCSLYYVVAHAPILDAIRSVSRIILVMSFPAAFLLGTLVDSIYNRNQNRALGRTMAVALVFGCLTETVFIKHDRSLVIDAKARIDRVEAQVRASRQRPLRPDDVLVLATPDRSDAAREDWTQIDAMLVAQKLGIKTLNGYSGNAPPSYLSLSVSQEKRIASVLHSAMRFREMHHLPKVAINPDNLVLVGFKEVAPNPDPTLAIAPGSSFTVKMNGPDFADHFLGLGWSPLEPEFVWSDGAEAELHLKFASSERKRLYLDLAAFLPRPDSTQHVKVTANEVALGEATFTRQSNRGVHYFDLPANLGNTITLKIFIDHPRSPFEENLSFDPRDLGVALYGLGLGDPSP